MRVTSQMNKTKMSSEVFCTLNFVDNTGHSTVSPSPDSIYRTNGFDITTLFQTANQPLGRICAVQWNQEIVLDSQIGILRATYVHIEVLLPLYFLV